MFKKIALALDGSKCADEAFEVALNLARNEPAQLFVCSIVDPLAVAGTALPPAAIDQMIAARKLESRHLVQAATEKAQRAGVCAEGETHFGSPSEEILRLAKRHETDAIVMGTHGRSGFKRFFLGSVAETVLRYAACPVIVVRERSAEAECAMNGCIVVPVDGSELSLHALDLAIDLSKATDASLKIVHVVDVSKAAVISYGDPQYVSSLLSALRDDGVLFLQLASERAADRAASFGIELLEGNPAREIVRCAARSGAGWVVMASHGRSGLSHLVAGSVAEGVFRRSTVPVLVVPQRAVRRPGAAFSTFSQVLPGTTLN